MGNKKPEFRKIFTLVSIAVLVISSSNLQIALPIVNQFLVVVVICLDYAYGFWNVFSKKFTIYDILLVLFVMILTTISLLLKNYDFMAIVGLTFLNLRGDILELCKAFLVGTTIGLLGTISFAYLGLFSKYNQFAGTLSVGFKNENTAGFLISSVSTLTIFLLLNDRTGNLVRRLFLSGIISLISLAINTIVFNDSTASIIPFVFLGLAALMYFSKQLKFLKFLFALMPFALAYASVKLAESFSGTPSQIALNNLLTNRIGIWNYYTLHFPFSLTGTKITIFSVGLNRTIGNGAFDGWYIFAPIVWGCVIFAIFLIGMLLANFFSLTAEKYLTIALLVTLEVGAFSENIFVSAECILSVVALEAFLINRRFFKT